MLFERWAISFYEPSQQSGQQRPDPSELILLTQSLYSFLRLLPAHNAKVTGLSYRIWCEEDTIAGSPLIPSFNLSSTLKAYKLKSAVARGVGKLSISVLFDTAPQHLPETTGGSRPVSCLDPGKRFDLFRRNEFWDGESPPKVSYIDVDAEPSAPRSPSLSTSPPYAAPPAPLRASSPMPIPRILTSPEFPFSPSGTSLRYSSSASSDFGTDREIDEEPRTFVFRDGVSFGIPRRRSSIRLWGMAGGNPPWPMPNVPSVVSGPSAEPFGTLVGSYEESLLTGRMSALPSHPVMFDCQIGVVGLYSRCPPHLRCPPHVNISFPAYFYELPGQDRSVTPYVGVIDVDSLSTGCEDGLTEAGRRVARRKALSTGTNSLNDHFEHCGYRIPMKGQLQIVSVFVQRSICIAFLISAPYPQIIKNPSLTALKVFLVPYDFRRMPVGTKTFLRQKSYAVPTSTAGTGDSASLVPVGGRPPGASLRYAIHVQFACPSRRHLYLCRSMRVVFSPRREEALHVVTTEPEDAAKFTPLDVPFPSKSSPSKRGSVSSTGDSDPVYAFSNLIL